MRRRELSELGGLLDIVRRTASPDPCAEVARRDEMLEQLALLPGPRILEGEEFAVEQGVVEEEAADARSSAIPRFVLFVICEGGGGRGVHGEEMLASGRAHIGRVVEPAKLRGLPRNQALVLIALMHDARRDSKYLRIRK